MQLINQDGLLHFLTSNKINDNICNHLKFLEWENDEENIILSLNKIGELNLEPNFEENKNYWGKDSKIEFGIYPYFDCEILQCEKCKNLFFYYVELGGHSPQKRLRLIRKELIDLNTLKPKTQVVIDYEGLDYQVYKNEDLTYEISISKNIENIAVTVEVYHKLTIAEQNDYIAKGIISLEERIADMERNYNNYKVISWR
ncbi:hypothetical protein ABF176_002471 [Flavobacterium psychrophilum]